MSLYRRDTAATTSGPAAAGDDAYARRKAREGARQKKQSAKAREIAPIPPVEDLARKAAAMKSFRFFCETYFPERFPLAWSDDHLTVIADFQRCIVDGGLQAVAMPRGSGKTTLAECAVLWAILRGEHEMVGLIGATQPAAREMLASLDTELRSNDRLAADFPEVCHPIRRLDGVNQCRLLFEGRPVVMKFEKDSIRLPSLPENPAASAIIKVAGLTGRVRGMKFTRPDGRVVRPKLVVIDDAQTDRSARSLKQTESRERLIAGTVLGLVGPNEKMSAIMPCTVIEPGDLAERFLDRQKRPEWCGRRTKLMLAMPAGLERWTEYWETRAAGMREEDGGAAGDAFYAEHRDELDRGAIAAWPARHPGALSAIQYGMNLYLEDAAAFYAEYQNDPAAARSDEGASDPASIIVRQSPVARRVVPAACEYVAVGVDVQQKLLYWTAIAADPKATPAILDYNTWPDQKRQWFTLRDATRTIQRAFAKQEAGSQLYAALEALVAEMVGIEFAREDGSRFRVGRIVIDARWRDDVIFRFCKQSPHGNLLLPALGVTTKGTAGGWKERKTQAGEVLKHDFRLCNPAPPKKPVRYAMVDSDAWISRVHDALRTPAGSTGALLLPKERAENHQCYAEQLCAEYSTEALVNGRVVKKWLPKPGNPDNHWLDSTKLALLGTYVLGAEPAYVVKAAPRKRTPRKATYF